MANPAPKAAIQVINASGPVAGATCEYYLADAGGNNTSTPQAVYSDPDLGTSLGAVLNGANASNATGYFLIHWLDPAVSYYRIVKDSLGAQIASLCGPVQAASSSGSGTVGVITTIAALQTKDWGSDTEPTILFVIANTSNGDGGGIFRLDSADTTTADNGATVIVDANGNRWKRQTLDELFNLATVNGWYNPGSNTPTLRANSVSVASATSTGGLLALDVSAPSSALAAGWRGTVVETHDESFTLEASDVGKTIRHTNGSAYAWTIPPVATVAWPIGAMIRFRSIGSGAITLTRGAGVTLRIAGVSTDANATLAQWGDCVATHEDTNVWVVAGTNVS